MTDSAEGLEIENLRIGGNSYQEAGEITDDEENVIGSKPSIENPSEIEAVKGNVDVGVCNKNLIKFAKEDWIGGYFNSDGTVNSWGGIKEGLIDSRYYMIPNNLINIVLSFMPLRDLKISRGGLAFYNEDKNPISSTGININENILYSKGIRGSIKANVNIPNGAKYFRFYLKWVRNSENESIDMYEEFYDYISDLQLEVGIEASEYVEHKSQSYTIPVQQEMLKGDYLDLEKNEEVHVWGKWILDGVNQKLIYKHTSFVSDTQGFYLFNVDNKSEEYTSGSTGAVLCTHLITYDNTIHSNVINQDCIYWQKTDNVLYLSLPFTTIVEANNYLKEQHEADTPVTIYYRLKEPVRLPFTEEQKQRAEEIRNMRTHKGVTHVDSVAEGVKPILSFCYRKDLQIENEKMKVRLDEIEALLSTTSTSALLLDNLENDLKGEVM